jgi:hypothetical protein
MFSIGSIISAFAKVLDFDEKPECADQAVRMILEIREDIEHLLNDSTAVTSPAQMSKAQVLKTVDFIALLTVPSPSVRSRPRSFEIRIIPCREDRRDGQILTITSVTQGANGSVSVDKDGAVTYKPIGAPKADRFTVTVQDAEGDSLSKTITILAPTKHSGFGDW